MSTSTKTGSLQSISISQNEPDTLNQTLIQRSEEKKPSSTFVFPSLTNIAALFVKNSITMKRNILLLLFVFFIPAVGVFVNCIMIGKDPKELPIGFVNHENDCSETFYRDSCEANLLGCYFMTVSVHLYCTEPVINLLACIVQQSVHLYRTGY